MTLYVNGEIAHQFLW